MNVNTAIFTNQHPSLRQKPTLLRRTTVKYLAPILVFSLLTSCVTTSSPPKTVESPYSIQEQKAAQGDALSERKTLQLKRKIALGRISNETLYGKSLLVDQHNDVLGKQTTDILSKTLAESESFLVFERPDIRRLKDEAVLTGQSLDLIGVDALLIGSLTEFGRSTTGRTGFWSSTKKQTVRAKVDLRLVDAKTAQIIKSFSGVGETSTESGDIAGFGSRASYDASLNDRAISLAIGDAVNSLIQIMVDRPWRSDVLEVQGDSIFISGGKSQGVKFDMEFDLFIQGKSIDSKQTGFKIQLPGEKVGRIKVVSLFGDSETNQGAVAKLIEGNIAGITIDKLIVQEVEK